MYSRKWRKVVCQKQSHEDKQHRIASYTHRDQGTYEFNTLFFDFWDSIIQDFLD